MDDLLGFLFDGQPHPLAAPMATWLDSSRRFTAFVAANHTKIRKKVRSVQEMESLRDLQLEFETAFLLLRERSLSLAYEPQHPHLGRSPDFAVTFTTSLTFMVEVTRLRAVLDDAPASPLAGEQLADTVCGKLGQLLPGLGNVLIVGTDAPPLSQSQLGSVLLSLQQRAERNDPAILHRYRFQGRAGFFHHYQRLSQVLMRGSQLQPGEPVEVWVNPQAKHPLPSRVRTALYHSHIL